jgi:hypothetical protein
MLGLGALLLVATAAAARSETAAEIHHVEEHGNINILRAANVAPDDKRLNPLVWTLKEFEVRICLLLVQRGLVAPYTSMRITRSSYYQVLKPFLGTQVAALK